MRGPQCPLGSSGAPWGPLAACTTERGTKVAPRRHGVDQTWCTIASRTEELQGLPGTHLSSPRPHAMTFTSSGMPMGRSISGRNMPELPTSIHLFSWGE